MISSSRVSLRWGCAMILAAHLIMPATAFGATASEDCPDCLPDEFSDTFEDELANSFEGLFEDGFEDGLEEAFEDEFDEGFSALQGFSGGAPVSDDFNSTTLDTNLWTVVDPLGGAEFSMVGANTPDARLRISVPSGQSHSIWTDGIMAPRVTQRVDNVDFGVEVKFDSAMSSRYQLQGIVVEGDNQRYLRIEFYHDGSAYHHFTASFGGGIASNLTDRIIPGGAPMYLRLTRTGNNWLSQYSLNGQSWQTGANFSFSMVVRAVGPYVGNQGVGRPAPATIGLIDYFFNTASPIVPEDETGATLTRTATGEGAIVVVPDQPVYYHGETVTVTAVPAEGWMFEGWSGDLSGAQPVRTLDMAVSRTIHATFTQQTPAVTIDQVSVTALATSARVTVSTNVPTTAVLYYGRTPSYELGHIQSTSYTTQHVLDVPDLQPSTQYHYGIVCTGEQSQSAATPDAVFITTQAGVPVSDDFNSTSLNTGLWTVVNPLGDAEFSMVGTNTPDARLRISVPAGASHTIWTDGVHAPRVMQQVANVDFSVEAKFDSILTSRYQMQGILVQGHPGEFLRIEFYHDGTRYYHFVAAFAAGSATVLANTPLSGAPPAYLRVVRAGNAWSIRHSFNGQSWTNGPAFNRTISVRSIGPYAGNQGVGAPAPAFVGLIDYFFNTASPIVPEDGGGATLTRTVTGEGSIMVEPDLPAYYNNESVTVSAVPATGWTFQGWSGDLSGTQATQTLEMTTSRAVHATFVLHVPQVVISNVSVTAMAMSARVTLETNVLTTAALRYGRTPSYELGQLQDTVYATQHVIFIPNLQPATQYHYSITCLGQQGQSVSTPNATFTTRSAPASGVFSDDFNSFNLNPSLWTIVDPLNDAEFSIVGTNTSNARLRIAVPAGQSHTIWTNGISAPHVLQQANNTDLALEAKFDSVLTSRYQKQGILIKGDPGQHLRIEFYHDGSQYYHYVAGFSGGGVSTYANTALSAAPAYLRVTRTGNSWLVQHSTNGQSWTTGASFNRTITVRAVGPYAGNQTISSSPAPAFVGLVDYFFNTLHPVVPEDGEQVTDFYPPNFFTIHPVSGSQGFTVTWKTDEPSSSRVQYGMSTNYELGSVADHGLKTSHALTVTGLSTGTIYNFRLSGTDAAGNTGYSANHTVGTAGGPDINVWYGSTQEFGHWGMPQPMVSVLGNVSSPSGVSSLSYSLNGGSYRTLRMGPNSMRLTQRGDFNVEMSFAELWPGANQVIIRAVDGLGQQSQRLVTVIDSSGPVWPLPYSVNWSYAGQINNVSQVVDGLWAIQGGYVRPQVMAYDRLIAIGDRGWRNYEVTCPITVHALDSAGGYAPPSYGPGIGLLLRWPGHSNDGSQPWQGVYPLGAIGMFRWTTNYERFEIFGNYGHILAHDSSGEKMQLNTTYIFKMRVSDSGSSAQYRFKWWRSGQPEPSNWNLTGSQSLNNDPRTGSLLLLAHHVDATFGSVSVVPVP